MKILWTSLFALMAMVSLGSAQTEEERPKRDGARGDATGKPRPKGEKRGEHQEGVLRGGREGRGHTDRFMSAYDRDKDKAVSWSEFQASKKMSHLEDAGKRRIFDHLDKNKDGKITSNELPQGGRAVNGSKRGDLNNDGKISFAEFQKNPRMKDAKPERLAEMFKRMDRDGDGFLTPRDFPRPHRGPLFDRGLMEKLDENKDQALSFDEWSKSPRLKDLSEERKREMFDRIDRNHDGKLDEADRGEGPRRGSGGERPSGERPGPGPGLGGRSPEGRRPEQPRGPKPKGN
jgi:Ca2+-binding EF-hand superfamily protein